MLSTSTDTTYCWDRSLCEVKSLKNKVHLWYWGAAQASVFKESGATITVTVDFTDQLSNVACAAMIEYFCLRAEAQVCYWVDMGRGGTEHLLFQ